MTKTPKTGTGKTIDQQKLDTLWRDYLLRERDKTAQAIKDLPEGEEQVVREALTGRLAELNAELEK